MKGHKFLRRKELTIAISMLLAASGTALAEDQDDAIGAGEEVKALSLRQSFPTYQDC